MEPTHNPSPPPSTKNSRTPQSSYLPSSSPVSTICTVLLGTSPNIGASPSLPHLKTLYNAPLPIFGRLFLADEQDNMIKCRSDALLIIEQLLRAP